MQTCVASSLYFAVSFLLYEINLANFSVSTEKITSPVFGYSLSPLISIACAGKAFFKFGFLSSLIYLTLQ